MKAKQRREKKENGDSITHGAWRIVRVVASPFNLCSGNENLEEKRSNTGEPRDETTAEEDGRQC